MDELRGRAGILLSAAAVVSAFLGAGPLTTDRAHPATVLGVLAFAGVVATTLAILVPWPFIKWEWRFGTKKILGDYIESEPSASMAEIYRSLAWHYAEMRGRNDRKIRALRWLFIAASGLIGLQTIAWLLAPSGGG